MTPSCPICAGTDIVETCAEDEAYAVRWACECAGRAPVPDREQDENGDGKEVARR